MQNANDYELTRYCDEIADELWLEADRDRDTALDYAHEAADGSEWVIYHGKARELCGACDVSEGEAFVEDVGLPDPFTFDALASMVAYGEIRARISQRVEELAEEWDG